ncbi:MAG: hypothetical protein E6R03_00350 [Hyphomicrobiaceae bacterium]|nr:MAG: hypothetical protein E6R03_00350 [Hyphomicrobiaceae bacterium]
MFSLTKARSAVLFLIAWSVVCTGATTFAGVSTKADPTPAPTTPAPTTPAAHQLKLPEKVEWIIGSIELPKVVAETGASEVGWDIQCPAMPPLTAIPHVVLGKTLYLTVATPGVYVVTAWTGPRVVARCLVFVLDKPSVPPTTTPGGAGQGDSSADTGDGVAADAVAAKVTSFLIGSRKDSMREDARTLAFLYGYVAETLARDGERASPQYATIAAASGVLRTETETVLKGTKMRGIKEDYPDFYSLATGEFLRVFGTSGSPGTAADPLPAEKRAEFVRLLRSLSRGCLLASLKSAG